MNKLEIYNEICNDIKNCNKCQLRSLQPKTPIPGEGNLNAKLVFVGECPGMEESEQVRPFVGRSGKLLNKMIEAMGMKREDVFIMNTGNCRPPNNRRPTPEEVKACSEFLDRQLLMVKPEVVIVLGTTAMERLLGKGEGITKRHGKIEEYKINDFVVKVIPVYHPSYMLRNPAAKIDAAKDLAIAKALIGD
jgi:DNA polymerase